MKFTLTLIFILFYLVVYSQNNTTNVTDVNYYKNVNVNLAHTIKAESHYSQAESDSSSSEENSILAVKIDWGLIEGLCIGGKIYFASFTSFEFSYGAQVSSLGVARECFKAGLNFHDFLSKECAITPSIAMWKESNKNRIEHVFVGIDWGVNKNQTKGLNLILKFGLYLDYWKDKEQFQIFPNIDVGFSFDF